ncbi:MAG: hypothetical protein QM734_16760 [Cyclobacteriaceae bacterium]
MSFKVIVLLLVFSTQLAPAQYNTNEKKASFYFELTKKYEPDAYEILKSEVPERFLVYAGDGETAKSLIENFETLVHETCHGYNFKIGIESGWNHNGYFISDGCKIGSRKEDFFPSSVLNNVVPKEQQEKIFRYKTYVSGESKNSASLEGVYGFVDEFAAYYHGTRAALELLPYYETICPYTDAHCWVDEYLSQMQSTLYAYYEFRLFIAWYLMYAESHEQKIFNQLMNNRNLRLAYTLLDIQFKKLVEDYFDTRTKIVNKLNASGNNVTVQEKFILITVGNSSSGIGIPDDDIVYLKGLFTSKENVMLERFQIKGADLSNFKKFLEEDKPRK